MSRNSHCSDFFKKVVLKNFSIFIGKHLCRSLFLIKVFQHRYFPGNIAEFFITPILKNICEQLLLNVIFSSNEQHFLARLSEIVQDIIMFYIYLYHFSIIIFAFSPEAVAQRCFFKKMFKKLSKFSRKHLCRSLL